jgi:hypothetical protein
MRRIQAKPVPLPEGHFERLAEIKRRSNECNRKRYDLDKQTMAENKAASYSVERAAIRDAEWEEWVLAHDRSNRDLIE